MDGWEGVRIGFGVALQPLLLLYCLAGVFLGTFIGVLPGIGAMSAIALLLPVTYHVDALPALVMLAGIYYGAQYGGSTCSILLNLPGTPSSVVTCLDGHPLAQQGRAGVALFLTTAASFVGSMLGIVLLALFSPAIARLGLSLGPADYAAMMLLGLLAASSLSGSSPLKGWSMVLLGLLAGTVGIDVHSGMARFVFGMPALVDGINMVALAMGLLGLSEIMRQAGQSHAVAPVRQVTLASMWPTRDDWRRSVAPALRGTAVGSFFGALPGTGAAMSSFMSYVLEKKLSRHPERFGQGELAGIVAPEAANNAAAQTAFVPTLSLGIPGDVVMALMLGALILHGITPGPMLMTEQPVLFWGLVASFALGNLMLVILNIPLIGLWVRLLQIPYHWLYPVILVLMSMGVYSLHANADDILLVAVLGLLGWLLRALDYPVAPLLLGFVLGPQLEEHLRRALLLSHGSPLTFVQHPVSASFMLACVLVLVWPWWSARRRAAQSPVRSRVSSRSDDPVQG